MAPSVSLIANANDAFTSLSRSIVKLSSGKFFAVRPAATNPFWYSADGTSWTQLTSTPTHWNNNSGLVHSVCIDAADHIFIAYTHDNFGANNGRLGLVQYDYSGATPTLVNNQGWIADQNQNGYVPYALAVNHPNGTAGHSLIVIMYNNQSGTGRSALVFATSNGTTITGGSSIDLWEPATGAPLRPAMVLHHDGSNVLVPGAPTAPVFSCMQFDNGGSGTGLMLRRTATWNGTNFTLGTSRSTSVANNAGFHRAAAYTGSEVVVVYSRASGVSGHRFVDASAVTATAADPPTTGIPAAIDFVHLFRNGTEAWLFLADIGVAGFKKSVWTTSWSAYTTVLAGAGEIDNFAAYSSSTPSNAYVAMVKDEAGATDQIYAVIFGEPAALEMGGAVATVEINPIGAGLKQAASGAAATVEVDPSGAGTRSTMGGSSAQVEIDALGGGQKIKWGGSIADVEVVAFGDGQAFLLLIGGSTAVVVVTAFGDGANTLFRELPYLDIYYDNYGVVDITLINPRHSQMRAHGDYTAGDEYRDEYTWYDEDFVGLIPARQVGFTPTYTAVSGMIEFEADTGETAPALWAAVFSVWADRNDYPNPVDLRNAMNAALMAAGFFGPGGKPLV